MSVRDDIQKLYIGYLGRPADAAGLDYWEKEISDGVMTMEQLRSNLVNEQPEYAEIYGDKTRAQLVTEIYTNLFERAPEAAGFEYWVNGDGSTVEADQLIEAFLNAASTDDQAVVDNKLEVANHYTAELGGADTFDKAEAATFIDAVDGTDASVIDAKGDIDAAVAVSGETFTLTEAFAADELPASYTLTDASIDLDTLTVAAANEQLAELQTIIDGADNADELTLDASYTLEDSLENFMAAEEGVVDDADSYTIADGIGPLSTGTFAEMQIIANATEVNVLDEATVQQIADFNTNYDNLGTYSLADTTASLLDAASSDIVAGAEGITVSGALTVDQYSAFDAEFARDFTYSLADTLDNLAAAPEGVVDGADDYSLADAPDAFTDLSVADALSDVELSIGEGALNSDDYVYTLSDTLENFMGAAEGVVDDADSYTIDAAAVYNAGEQTVADVNADYTEAADLIAGAENSADLTLAGLFTYSLADTFENLVAAEDSLVDDAAAYSLTDPAGTDLGELSGDEYAVADGATNTEDFTFTVEPADVLSITPASSTVVEGEAITLDVALSHAVNVDRVLDYKLEGVETAAAAKADPLTDLGQITGKVTVAAGETTATITLTPAVDVTEGLEAFSVKVLDENFAVAQSTDPITIQDAPNSGQAFTLTADVDEWTGTAGNDTVTASYDGEASAHTLSDLDTIDGAAGQDVLKITNTTAALDTTTIGGLDISNIETVTLRSSKDATVDTSDWSGVTSLSTTQVAGDAIFTAATTTDITVSGVTGGDGGAVGTGLVQVDGGKDVSVTDGSFDNDITIGATTVNSGTITVADSEQSTAAINVDGGTDVTITSGAEQDASGGGIVAGAVNVGQGGATGDAPTGAVAITQNLISDGTDNLTGSAVTVTGGTTVDVTINATNTDEASATNGTAVTTGAVDITGDDATTDVTVSQTAAATGSDKVDAVEGVNEVSRVDFGDLANGENVVIEGLTVKNNTGAVMDAADVAAAFANLADTAQGCSTDATYSGTWSGDYTSSAVMTDTTTDTPYVLFTAVDQVDQTAPGTSDLAVTDSGSTGTVTKSVETDGVAEVDAEAAVGTIANGTVGVADGGDDSITSITLDGYGTATLASDVLETLNLSNSAAAVNLDTASTGAIDLTVDNVTSAIDLGAVSGDSVTTVNITATGDDSDIALDAAAATALTVDATADIDLADGTFTALETVTVSGAGDVVFDTDEADTLTAVNAAAATGALTAFIDAGQATYTGSAGADSLTLTAVDVDKAVDLGDGDDTLVIAAGTVASDITVDIVAGNGTDTLSMGFADAVAVSANEDFDAAATGFEKLDITGVVGSEVGDLDAGDGGYTDVATDDTYTVDLSMLTYDYVSTSGTDVAGGDSLVLDNMVSGGTVALTADGLVTVNVVDAATGTADTLNVDAMSTAANGTLTAADVETINIVADNDNGTANDAVTMTLVATSAETLTLSGADDLTLTNTGNVALTSVDASAMTGELVFATDASAAAAATVTGGEGDDDLTGNVDQDVLIGGAGDDTLTSAADLQTLTGGAGNDTFTFTTAVSSVNKPSVITDAEQGDVIAINGATSFDTAAVALDPDGNPDLQNYADEAIAGITSDGGMSWFEYNNNTYIVMEADNSTSADTFVNGEDFIVKLTGSVDLSTASFNDAGAIQICA
jgi:S-layer protein